VAKHGAGAVTSTRRTKADLGMLRLEVWVALPVPLQACCTGR
jgi:hypothetical protein